MKLLKTLFIALFALVALSSSAQKAIGLRFGGGSSANGIEFSYQQGMGDANRVELDLGLYSNSYFSSFDLTGTYQWTFPLADIQNLGWYVGPGASVAMWTYDSGIGSSTSGIGIGIGGIIGIDYTLESAPIQFSIDSRPMVNFNHHYGGNWGGALSVRYVF